MRESQDLVALSSAVAEPYSNVVQRNGIAISRLSRLYMYIADLCLQPAEWWLTLYDIKYGIYCRTYCSLTSATFIYLY